MEKTLDASVHVKPQSYTTESSVINHQPVEIEEQLRIQITNMALKAIVILYEILVNPNSTDQDKITAAKDLLDHEGFKLINKIQIQHTGSHTIE
jgi:hypothetical protein